MGQVFFQDRNGDGQGGDNRKPPAQHHCGMKPRLADAQHRDRHPCAGFVQCGVVKAGDDDGIRPRRSGTVNLGQHEGAADGVIFRPLNGRGGIVASDAFDDRARRCVAGGSGGLFRHRHCRVGVDHDNPHHTNPRPASDPFRARRRCMIVTDRITRTTSDSEKIVVSVPSA